MKIGIFDSGIGGLFVLKELMNKHKNNQYIYYGDTIHLPYGEKTKEDLKKYSDKIIKFLEKEKVDLIIIACGTISSNIYEEIKYNYHTKIYDIISPTIEYVNNSVLKKVGVIGTQKTIESDFFKKNIFPDTICIPCPMFVDIIENAKINEYDFYINKYLKKIKTNRVDALILGCTHYPYLSSYIKEYLNYKLDILDMGKILCNRINITDDNKFELKLYFSKINKSLENNVYKILENKYKIVEKVL